MSFAPICLFVYRRFDCTVRTVESLLRCPESINTDLYIFSDGPKDLNDVKRVEEVRNYLLGLKGFKSINYNFSTINLGLANSVISGVTKVINKYESVIVVEDDLELSSTFLRFMNDALTGFIDREDVISICGFSKIPIYNPLNNGCYRSARFSSWGWATWASRWNKVDFKHFEKNSTAPSILLLIKLFLVAPDLPRMLLSQVSGKIDSWAIRFVTHQIDGRYKSIHPRLSLVKNIGFGNLASNTDIDIGQQALHESSALIEHNITACDLSTIERLNIWILEFFFMFGRYFYRRSMMLKVYFICLKKKIGNHG
jgi:hypothetical protein